MILSSGSGTCDTADSNSIVMCGGEPVWKITGTNSGVSSQFTAYGSMGIATGAGVKATLVQGGFGLPLVSLGSITGTYTNHVAFYVVPGTAAFSCKVVVVSGSTATPVVIADNIGNGC